MAHNGFKIMTNKARFKEMLMKRFRKAAAVAVLLIIMLPLAAAPMSVEWSWLLDDPDISAFRYQIDSESDEGWTVLPADTDSITIDGLDSSVEYAFYLQRSYDGENWSESAVSYAKATETAPIEPVIEEEPAPVEETVVAEEPAPAEEEVVAVEEAVAVEETAPVEEVAPAEEEVIPAEKEVVVVEEITPAEAPAEKAPAESRFAFSLLPRFGVASTLFDFDRALAEVGIGFDFAHIISAGDHFSLGLRSDLVCNFLPVEGSWTYEDKLEYFNIMNYAESVLLDLKLMMDVTAGPMDLYIGGGAGYGICNPVDAPNLEDLFKLYDFSIGGADFGSDWFASAIAGIRFSIGNVFSLGVEANYRYMVTAKQHVGSADVVLGFTF